MTKREERDREIQDGTGEQVRGRMGRWQDTQWGSRNQSGMQDRQGLRTFHGRTGRWEVMAEV